MAALLVRLCSTSVFLFLLIFHPILFQLAKVNTALWAFDTSRKTLNNLVYGPSPYLDKVRQWWNSLFVT